MADPKNDFIAAIQDLAVTMPFSKITIDTICERTDYSRQTFYRHFTDKYDLAFSIFERDLLKSQAAVDENWTFSEACKIPYNCLAANKSFYKSVFKHASSKKEFFDRFAEHSIQYTIDAIGKKKLSRDQKLLIRIWTISTLTLLEKWIQTGMSEDPTWYIDMATRLMPEEIKQVYLN